MATLELPNDGQKYTRDHNQALLTPRQFERPIVEMVRAWVAYAAKHRERYEAPIGEDYVIGDAWIDMGKTIIRLLDGDTGRLDCGTIDRFIRITAKEQGTAIPE